MTELPHLNNIPGSKEVRQPAINIIMDFGNKTNRSFSSDRPLRHYLASASDVAFTPVYKPDEIDLDKHDPSRTVVVAASSTVDIKHYEDAGFTVYPTSEKLAWISNKWTLYELCRQHNIPTVLSFPLRTEGLKDFSIKQKMSMISNNIGGLVAKPENSYGNHRDHIPDVFTDAVGQIHLMEQAVDKYMLDFTLQKKHKGKSMKVYGVWPNEYYYLDEKDTIQRCPPNITKTCKRLAELTALPFGGLDFMISSEGVWELIDINPPSGGRPLPETANKERFKKLMREAVERLLNKESLPKTDHKIKVFITAGGQGVRMEDITQGIPKSLLPIKSDITILDKVYELTSYFTRVAGFDPIVELMTMQDKIRFFEEWIKSRNYNHNEIEISTPNPKLFVEASSFNHTLADLPAETDLILSFAADRIIDIPADTINRLAVQIRKAFDESIPYLLVGVLDDSSKHRIKTDQNGTIISYDENGKNNIGTMGIKKIAFGFDAAKATVSSAGNSFEVIRKMMKSGVLGKLILLDNKEITVNDIDTLDDWNRAKSYYE